MTDLDKALEVAENMTYDEFCDIKKEKGITTETYSSRTYNNDFKIDGVGEWVD